MILRTDGKVKSMSFSQEVKDELVKHYVKARHCSLAELNALITFSGDIVSEGKNTYRMTCRGN